VEDHGRVGARMVHAGGVLVAESRERPLLIRIEYRDMALEQKNGERKYEESCIESQEGECILFPVHLCWLAASEQPEQGNWNGVESLAYPLGAGVEHSRHPKAERKRAGERQSDDP